MISHANKGIIFNMLRKPYEDEKYEAYNPMLVHYRLQDYSPRKLEVVERYMDNNSEFTIYFYL